MPSFKIIGAVVSAAAASDIYAEPPQTVLGCKCTGACKVNPLVQCATADFCSVESSECGRGRAEWELGFGHFDYCTFPAHQPYEQRTAKEKKAMLLAEVKKDNSSSSYPSPATGVITGTLAESVRLTFEAHADVMVEPRTKWIHTVGVTGGIKFENSGNHTYTGVFKGAEHGIIRLSSAKQPGLGGFPDTRKGFAPGAALKFLRDGRPSANFMAMPGLDGQHCTDTNFFSQDFHKNLHTTNDWSLELIKLKFWQASYCPLMVGLSDIADEADTPAAFPFQLVLHPLVSSECSCSDYAACLKNLASIAVGTRLFEVQAAASPGGTLQAIGFITLTDELTPSKFGDEQLFFKHTRMEDDFRLRPQWLQQINKATSCGMNRAGTPAIKDGCTSPFTATNLTQPMLPDDVVV